MTMRLLIVADEATLAVPFAALVDEQQTFWKLAI